MISTTSSSNGYNLIQASKEPIVYSYSITTLFIVITSILNVCVLSRRTLRSSPCTYYFLASIPPILLYLIVAPVSMILQNRYGFYISGTSITCKICPYLIYTTSLLYGLMLACASIDRFCSSSISVRLRHLSQVRVARKIIIIIWILSLIYMSPFIFIYNYDPTNTNTNKCMQSSTTTTLTAVYLMSRVILYYFLIPICLIIFGLLTISNIRNQKRRVNPVNQTNIHRRTEGQLARMLIIQVALYILFFTPSCIIYILVTFVPSMNTSYYATIRSLAGVWLQGGYFISFFLYVLTGKIYRQELKKMFKCDRIHNNVHRIPMGLTGNTRCNVRH